MLAQRCIVRRIMFKVIMLGGAVVTTLPGREEDIKQGLARFEKAIAQVVASK